MRSGRRSRHSNEIRSDIFSSLSSPWGLNVNRAWAKTEKIHRRRILQCWLKKIVSVACATQPVSYFLNLTHVTWLVLRAKSYLRKFILLIFVKSHHPQNQMEHRQQFRPQQPQGMIALLAQSLSKTRRNGYPWSLLSIPSHFPPQSPPKFPSAFFSLPLSSVPLEPG